MKYKLIWAFVLCLGLVGCGHEETSQQVEPFKFSEQIYYSLPGEKIPISSSAQNINRLIRSFSQSQTAENQVSKVVIEGQEYFDVDNIYAPEDLGDFEIVAYDRSGSVLATSSVNTDSRLVSVEVRQVSDVVAMDGNIAAYQAIGTFDADGTMVSRDISNSVNWDVSGSIKSFDDSSSIFYYEGTGDANLSISYGEFSQDITTTVISPLVVNSRSATIGSLTALDGQVAKLPGKDTFDLSVKLHYEDGTEAIDDTIVWQLATPHSGVNLVGNKLYVKDNNIDFTLNAYSTSVVDGKVELSASPDVSIDVEVGGVDMTLTNFELQLEKATYRVGDKLKYTVYKIIIRV